MSDEIVSNAELARLMVRMESKLDKVWDDHEQRLRRLERAIWIMSGTAAAGATSGVGALITAVMR